MTVSKVEEDTFRYTGLDVKIVSEGIKIPMEDYSKSLKEIKEIRKTDDRNEPLTKLEMKMYRKMTGKIAWLANSTRPDLCFQALQMSKKNQGAVMSDLRDVNRILKRVQERESKIKYGYIGEKEDLVIIGLGDASYKQDDKAVGGVVLFLANSTFTRASPIYWKSKQIERVCHSSKDAETLNLVRMVDDAVLAARQLEMLLYGDILQRIPIYLFTDSESTLESVASSKQISTKTLRNVISDLKQRLVDGEVTSYAWLSTSDMWADILTKEMKMPPAFENVILRNDLFLGNTSINRVMAFGQEIRMVNIRNRTSTSV